MIKVHHANRGVAVVLAIAAGLAALTLLLYEIGARHFGLHPPSARLLGEAEPPSEESRRHGRMWVKVDNMGNCREFSIDNRTQQMVDKGVVTCDPARKQEIKTNTTSKFDSFRDAFGGK